MSRFKIYLVLSLAFPLLFFISIPKALSWGYHAHKKINHEAVCALPATLEAFYKKNIDYITAHSVDPDNHKYSDSLEAQRHFIDIDHYGPKAFEVLPTYWKAALDKYGKDTLQKYGTLPYEVLYWENELTDAFKNKDGNEILRASAYIGHYIADAHVPLHTITNYDGQKTEQEGIHALWETAIPEAYSDKYVLRGQKAAYIKDPEVKIWEIIKQSYALAPTVLSVEKQVGKNFTEDKKYKQAKAPDGKRQFTDAYISAYNKALNGMVAKQMQSSVLDIAAFWYTAWVNAGQPELDKI